MYKDATWAKSGPTQKPSRSTRFGKIENFLEMGGFPSIQPYSLYGAPVRYFFFCLVICVFFYLLLF